MIPLVGIFQNILDDAIQGRRSQHIYIHIYNICKHYHVFLVIECAKGRPALATFSDRGISQHGTLL